MTTAIDRRSLAPSDISTCQRCGIERIVNASRNVPICRDCRWVEHGTQAPAGHGIYDGQWVRHGHTWRWESAACCTDERMCNECRKWAEKAAETGFWRQWQTRNRRFRGPNDAMKDEAYRRARKYDEPIRKVAAA